MRRDANRIPAKFSVLSRATPARDQQIYLTAPLGEAATRKTWTAEGGKQRGRGGSLSVQAQDPRDGNECGIERRSTEIREIEQAPCPHQARQATNADPGS